MDAKNKTHNFKKIGTISHICICITYMHSYRQKITYCFEEISGVSSDIFFEDQLQIYPF